MAVSVSQKTRIRIRLTHLRRGARQQRQLPSEGQHAALPPQTTKSEPAQTVPPARHESPSVQGLPSSQAAPAVIGVCLHPVNGLQSSTVHGSPSSQSASMNPEHEPSGAHVLAEVHMSPSSQGMPATTRWWQPLAAAQVSIVQTTPSSQLTEKQPPHVPRRQRSPEVHMSPSSQE